MLFAENVSGTAYGYPVTGYGCAMFGVGSECVFFSGEER